MQVADNMQSLTHHPDQPFLLLVWFRVHIFDFLTQSINESVKSLLATWLASPILWAADLTQINLVIYAWHWPFGFWLVASPLIQMDPFTRSNVDVSFPINHFTGISSWDWWIHEFISTNWYLKRPKYRNIELKLSKKKKSFFLIN